MSLLGVVAQVFWLQISQDRFPLRNGETTLGRSQYCTVVIDSPAASREHACINVTGARIEIRDLGSRNGTKVNGVRISRSTRLMAGDTISLGSVKLILSEMPSYSDAHAATIEHAIPPDIVAAFEPADATQPAQNATGVFDTPPRT